MTGSREKKLAWLSLLFKIWEISTELHLTRHFSISIICELTFDI